MKKNSWAPVASQFSFNTPNVQSKRSADEKEIRSVLDKQVIAWNEANIDEFMKGPIGKSDSILFIGRKSPQGGQHLNSVQKKLSCKAAMGILRFEILRMDFASTNAC